MIWPWDLVHWLGGRFGAWGGVRLGSHGVGDPLRTLESPCSPSCSQISSLAAWSDLSIRAEGCASEAWDGLLPNTLASPASSQPSLFALTLNSYHFSCIGCIYLCYRFQISFLEKAGGSSSPTINPWGSQSPMDPLNNHGQSSAKRDLPLWAVAVTTTSEAERGGSRKVA